MSDTKACVQIPAWPALPPPLETLPAVKPCQVKLPAHFVDNAHGASRGVLYGTGSFMIYLVVVAAMLATMQYALQTSHLPVSPANAARALGQQQYWYIVPLLQLIFSGIAYINVKHLTQGSKMHMILALSVLVLPFVMAVGIKQETHTQSTSIWLLTYLFLLNLSALLYNASVMGSTQVWAVALATLAFASWLRLLLPLSNKDCAKRPMEMLTELSAFGLPMVIFMVTQLLKRQ